MHHLTLPKGLAANFTLDGAAGKGSQPGAEVSGTIPARMNAGALVITLGSRGTGDRAASLITSAAAPTVVLAAVGLGTTGSGTASLVPEATASTASTSSTATAKVSAVDQPDTTTAVGVTNVRHTAARVVSAGRATIAVTRITTTVTATFDGQPRAWQYGTAHAWFFGPVAPGNTKPTGNFGFTWITNGVGSERCGGAAANPYNNTVVSGCLIGGSFVSGGYHQLVVSYEGDTLYAPSQAEVVVGVSPNSVRATSSVHIDPTGGALSLDATLSPDSSGNYWQPDGVVDGTVYWTSQPFNPQIATACPPTVFGSAKDDDALVGKVVTTPTCRIPHPIPGTYLVSASYHPRVPDDTYASVSTGSTYTVLRYSTTTTLALRPSTVAAGGKATAAVRVTPPTSAGTDMTGTVTVTTASGVPMCTVDVRADVGQPFNGSCDFTAHANESESPQSYVADFRPGNDANDDSSRYFNASTSQPASVSVTRSATDVTVVADDTQPAYGADVTLGIAVAADGAPVTEGRITVIDGDPGNGGTALGHVDLDGAGKASYVVHAPGPGRHTYFAVYADAPGQFDYLDSMGRTSPVTVDHLPAQLGVTATDDPSAATSAGVPVTVTGTVVLPDQDTAAAATIAIVDSAGGTPSCLPQTGTTTLTRICTFAEMPGDRPTFTATYRDDVVQSDPQTVTLTVSPTPTRATVTDASSVYGVAPVVAGTVTPVVEHVDMAGTVTFTSDGRPLCSVTVTVSDAVGAQPVSCSPASGTAVDAGTSAVTATYTPDPSATSKLTSPSTAAARTLIVAEAPVDVAIKVRPAGSMFAVDVTTHIDQQGAGAPVAVGRISFGAAAGTCGTMTLDAGGTVRCLVPASAAVATYSANFVATACATAPGTRSPGCDFVAGPAGSASTTYDPQAGPCFGSFAAFYAAARSGAPQLFTLSGQGSATVTLTGGTGPSDTCQQAGQLPATATVSLFSGTLRGSGVPATVDATGGLCLTGGSLTLPAAWNVGSLRTVSADPICFALNSTGGLQPATSGSLVPGIGSSAHLPLVTIPDVSAATSSLQVQVALACPAARPSTPGTCTGSSLVPALGVTATVDASTGAPGAQFAADIFADGTVRSDVSTTAFRLFGASTTLAGTVDRTGTGDFAVDVTGGLAGDASPAPGLTLLASTKVVRLTSAGTLTVSDTARVGSGSRSVPVGVSGSLASLDNYTLAMASAAHPPAWTPVAGLSFAPSLTGVLSHTPSSTTFSLTTAGGSAIWTAPNGITVTVDTMAVGTGAASIDPRCGYTGTAVAAISGTVAFDGVDLTGTACIDLAGGGWHIGVTGGSTTVGSAGSGQMDLTGITVDAARPAGGAVTVAGSATATVTVNGKNLITPVPLVISPSGLVVATAVGADGLGLPARTAYLAYSSVAVSGYDTGVRGLGALGKVDLPAGVSLFGAVPLPAALASTLSAAGLALPTNRTVTFSGLVPRDGGAPRFTADLGTPGALPFLRLPAGARVSGATVAYVDGALTLTVRGTVPGEDGQPAQIALDLVVADDGSVTGAGTVNNLHLFGQEIDLDGSISRSAGGTVSSTVQGGLHGDVTVGGVTLTDVGVGAGARGVEATGTLVTNGLSVPFDAVLPALSSYELQVSTTVSGWKPTPGVAVRAKITGSLTHRFHAATYFDFTALPVADDASLQTISPNGAVTVIVKSLELSNNGAPAGCMLGNGTVFLGFDATVRLAADTAAASSSTTGCFDLGNDTANLNAVVPGDAFAGSFPKVELGNIQISVTDRAGNFAATGSTRLTVVLPRAGAVGVNAPLVFTNTGFALGGSVDLSTYLFGLGGTGYLYFATGDGNFVTGVPSLGTLALKRGLTVGASIAVGTTLANALNRLGASVTSSSTIAAIAHVDPADTAPLILDVNLGLHPTTVFDTAGFSLHLDRLSLHLTVSKSSLAFGVHAEGTLQVPAVLPGGSPSQVALSGDITVGSGGLVARLRGSTWADAFGIGGLTVGDFGIQGGIGLDGVPTLGLDATVTRLPDAVASFLGYQQGAPMTVALNIDDRAPLVDLEIGTQSGSDAVLAPLAFTGHPGLFSVTYAKLYIAPKAGSVAGRAYPAGYSAAFSGRLLGVRVDASAAFDPSAKTLSADATVAAFDFGPLHIGGVSMSVRASRSALSLGLKGTAEVGPANFDIDVIRGHVDAKASLDITLGTSAISAFADLDLNLYVEMYLPTKTCSWGLFDGPCGFEWNRVLDTDIHTGNFGFSLDGGGFRLSLPYVGGFTLPFGSGTFPTLISATRSLTTTSPGTPASGTTSLDTTSARAASPGRIVLIAAHSRAVSTASGSPARWDTTGSLGSPRLLPAGAALSDGRVLLAGGLAGATEPLATAEVYDPSTGGWTATGSMHTSRGNAAAVVLPGGDVLVAGGATRSGETATAEAFDPKTGSWSSAGGLSQPRQGLALAELPNGTVLAIGGTRNHIPSTTVDSYAPSSRTWTRLPSLPAPRAAATATVLSDGDVLVAGGYDSKGALATGVRYHPGTRTWSSAGAMSVPTYFASSTLLPGGDVLVAGGSGVPERYHPATGTWSPAGTPKLSTMPGTLAAIAVLPNGDVVMAGGVQTKGTVASAAVYDPAANRWTTQPTIPDGVAGSRAFAVKDGVLFAGGGHATLGAGLTFRPKAGAYIFHPAVLTGAAVRPTTPRRAFTAASPTGTTLWTRPIAWAGYAVVLLFLMLAAVLVGRRRRTVRSAPGGAVPSV